MNLSEEDIRKQYPWDYGTLTEKLKNRYIDFKANPKYHELRKKIVTNPQYMKSRYLDPGNPSSSRKDFYSPNILREFDKSYTLRKNEHLCKNGGEGVSCLRSGLQDSFTQNPSSSHHRTDSFVFRYLQIPRRANPFFSHPYKTPGVSPTIDSKAFSVLSVSSALSVLNSFLHPFSISL
jgi:hypothetical protein